MTPPVPVAEISPDRRPHRCPLAPTKSLLTAIAVLGLASCGGGAGGDTEAFCEAAGEEIGAFRAPQGEVSPTIIGALRDLSLQAPDELSSQFETVTESSSQDELLQALDEIEQFVSQECGLDVQS
ncbi:hypothetical protein BH24ACT2_BH24ACT2_08070 [soil metagenome]